MCLAVGWVLTLRADVASNFYRSLGLELLRAENQFYSAVISPTGDYAYFGTNTTPGIVVKVNLSNFTREGAVTFSTGENQLYSAVISPTGDYAYFGTYTSPGLIIRVLVADKVSPATSVLGANPQTDGATLTWSSAGDDDMYGDLTGTYRIQYATFSATWSTLSTPANATTVTITTTSVVPGTGQSHTITGLTAGQTYFFVMWTKDDDNNWSGVSNEAVVSLSGSSCPAVTDLSAWVGTSTGTVVLSWPSAGDNGDTGVLNGTYRIQYSSQPTTVWSVTETPVGATTVEIATTSVVPGSVQRVELTVTSTENYHFVLWTQNAAGNWSEVSNEATSFPAYRSVLVNLENLDFGPQSLGSGSVVSSGGLLIENNGTLASTYEFRAVVTSEFPNPWTLSESLPATGDHPVLLGALHGTKPDATGFGAEDILGSTKTSSTSVFSINGSQTGVNVLPGEERTLWLRLDMPPTSISSSPQSFQIEVSANPPIE